MFVVSTVPVRFVEKPIDRHVTPGNLQITCSAFGIPAPKLTWLDINDTEVLKKMDWSYPMQKILNIGKIHREYIYTFWSVKLSKLYQINLGPSAMYLMI